MTKKELLKQIAAVIHQEFDQFNKNILASLQDIKKGQDTMNQNLATKADFQELTKTIHMYMEMIKIYRDKQQILEEKIEAILEYLDISSN